ncbi:unnamed protein product [Heterosigma akashiwo]
MGAQDPDAASHVRLTPTPASPGDGGAGAGGGGRGGRALWAGHGVPLRRAAPGPGRPPLPPRPQAGVHWKFEDG